MASHSALARSFAGGLRRAKDAALPLEARVLVGASFASFLLVVPPSEVRFLDCFDLLPPSCASPFGGARLGVTRTSLSSTFSFFAFDLANAFAFAFAFAFALGEGLLLRLLPFAFAFAFDLAFAFGVFPFGLVVSRSPSASGTPPNCWIRESGSWWAVSCQLDKPVLFKP